MFLRRSGLGSYEKGQSEIPHGTPAGLWAEAQAAEGSLHWPVSEYGGSSTRSPALELTNQRRASPKGESGPQALGLPARTGKPASGTLKPGRGFTLTLHPSPL